MKIEVFCTVQVEGTHNWPKCPYDEVAYLRVTHRHMFHIKAYKTVTHSDRDVEFICLKHTITGYFHDRWYDEEAKLCVFDQRSCEMIAIELINEYGLSKCEVSEDGENGAIVTV